MVLSLESRFCFFVFICFMTAKDTIAVSLQNPRYFEDSNGNPFIPIGLNLCFPRFVTKRAEGLARMKGWLDRLAENGGNFARLFLGHSFFDVEHAGFGRCDQDRVKRLDEIVEYAASKGIRLKLTLELFRTIDDAAQNEIFPGAVNFSRPFYLERKGGCFRDMTHFFQSEEGHRHFLEKVDRLAARYAGHPGVFGLDLWNEINTVGGKGWDLWTEQMLIEVKRRFPNRIVSQTLGSLCCKGGREAYRQIIPLAANEFSQVHRYLDLGAELDICHGPIDKMLADAVNQMFQLAPRKPAMVSECGAVEPNHSRPWDLYKRDTEGIVLHDALFAPFFAGACGSGQPWHWQEYVEANNLWWHFGRFSRAIEGIDPIKKQFHPYWLETERLRVYMLQGRGQFIAWCRDSLSDWKSELADGKPAEMLVGEIFPLPNTHGTEWKVTCYDPWNDKTYLDLVVKNCAVDLPPFLRSIVIRGTAE